jgi:hypothetical protein
VEAGLPQRPTTFHVPITRLGDVRADTLSSDTEMPPTNRL